MSQIVGSQQLTTLADCYESVVKVGLCDLRRGRREVVLRSSLCVRKRRCFLSSLRVPVRHALELMEELMKARLTVEFHCRMIKGIVNICISSNESVMALLLRELVQVLILSEQSLEGV